MRSPQQEYKFSPKSEERTLTPSRRSVEALSFRRRAAPTFAERRDRQESKRRAERRAREREERGYDVRNRVVSAYMDATDPALCYIVKSCRYIQPTNVY